MKLSGLLDARRRQRCVLAGYVVRWGEYGLSALTLRECVGANAHEID